MKNRPGNEASLDATGATNRSCAEPVGTNPKKVILAVEQRERLTVSMMSIAIIAIQHVHYTVYLGYL